MNELVPRAGLASADVLEDGSMVVSLESDELRAELADFVRRSGGRGGACAVWTEVPGPPRSPTLVLELRSASGAVFVVGLTMQAELFETAPAGPLTVALMLDDGIVDPLDAEAELAAGLIVATPELRR